MSGNKSCQGKLLFMKNKTYLPVLLLLLPSNGFFSRTKPAPEKKTILDCNEAGDDVVAVLDNVFTIGVNSHD